MITYLERMLWVLPPPQPEGLERGSNPFEEVFPPFLRLNWDAKDSQPGAQALADVQPEQPEQHSLCTLEDTEDAEQRAPEDTGEEKQRTLADSSHCHS